MFPREVTMSNGDWSTPCPHMMGNSVFQNAGPFAPLYDQSGSLGHPAAIALTGRTITSIAVKIPSVFPSVLNRFLTFSICTCVWRIANSLRKSAIRHTQDLDVAFAILHGAVSARV